MRWPRHLFSRRKDYDDLAEEIRQHLDERAEELIADGMSREKAEHAARREFGNVTRIEERGREAWQWLRLESIWADVRFALRQLRKTRGFTVTAILTLALGIGANTSIFTLVRALLLDSLPIADPGQLVRLAISMDSPNEAAHQSPLNYPILQSLQRRAKSFSGIFGWSASDFILRDETGSRIYSGAIVSGNTFQVLGVRPTAGRLLTPQDDQRGGGPDGWAAVISHRFWQEHYAGDPAVIGKHVTLTDHSVTIVGVAPEGFEGILVGTRPDFYLPLEFEPVMRAAGTTLRSPGNLWLITMARLKPDVSLQTASAEMAALFPSVMDETVPAAVRHIPVIEQARFVVREGRTGWSYLRMQYTKPLFLLQILVGVVLMVCCVNLAGLCLARAATRQHEFAIRGALGAARSRLMQQLLVESLLLAAAGGAPAIAFAWTTDRFLLRFLADKQAAAALAVRPDLSTLLMTGGCAVFCALLFGITPAWLASHISIDPVLRRVGPSMVAGQCGNLRRFFVPVQVGLTLALVVVAAMLGATVVRLRTSNTGFRTENVLFIATDFDRLPQKGLNLVRLYRRMVARIAEVPGIDSVSVAENPPLNGWRHTGAFAGEISAKGTEENLREKYDINDVGEGYFATLGTKMIAGRDFSDQDGDADTCILNRSAAASLFPAQPAIGRPVRQLTRSMDSGEVTTRDCRVIGIVEDAKYSSLREPAPPTVYLPFGVNTGRLSSLSLVIHARSMTEGVKAYAKALHELAPASPENEPIAFAVQFDDSIASERLLSVLSGFFALLALLLSGIGIYGLMASYVTQRTMEIGLRMALGATRMKVFSLVIRQVAVLLVSGTLIGGCLAFFAAHSIKAFLFDVKPGSPAIFASAVLLLALSGLAAAMLPARRAVSIEPMQVLRTE